jgi:NADP-dependent 3-hydroxy acid dehydrogenase YdfG
MAQTVLLTGTSSGIGEETALYFAERGWNVVATMRHPEKRETRLHEKENIHLLHLDVLDSDSIRAAVDAAVKQFDRIDALVNNAGYAVLGPFEASTPEKVRAQFDTNVMGLMETTRHILPIFRKQKEGILINVASVAGRTTYPLYTLYNSTKWAVEGFSESLQYELRPLNIKVKIIEPGVIKTDFYTRSLDVMTKAGLDDYNEFVKRVQARMMAAGDDGSPPSVIAETIYRAATDGSWRLRYAAGKNTSVVFALRKLLPDSIFLAILRSATTK